MHLVGISEIKDLAGTQQATFMDWSPIGNISKYLKNEGVLMTSKWGCGGQEVPDKGPDGPAVSLLRSSGTRCSTVHGFRTLGLMIISNFKQAG